jgi:putative GTP pyrophosphokinase
VTIVAEAVPTTEKEQMTKAPEEWGKMYAERFSFYQGFNRKLRDLFEELLKWEGIELAQIEWRTKSVESFVEKIRRKGKYTKPLVEVTDLVGIRLIAYYTEDVGRIGGLIEHEFTIDRENSSDKSVSLDPDKFGYLSIHYVISLSSPRKELREWKDFADAKAEVQVRTVLQHAWAAIDHKLNYKNTLDVPKPLRRQLFRLSALLELADEEFSDLRRRIEEVQEHYALEVQKGELNLEINLDSLDAYLLSRNLFAKWEQTAEQIGFRKSNLTSDYVLAYKLNTLSWLVTALKSLGILTIEELDRTLGGADEWGNEAIRKIYDNSVKENFTPVAIGSDLIAFLVLYAKRGKLAANIIDVSPYIAPIKSALRKLSENG